MRPADAASVTRDVNQPMLVVGTDRDKLTDETGATHLTKHRHQTNDIQRHSQDVTYTQPDQSSYIPRKTIQLSCFRLDK